MVIDNETVLSALSLSKYSGSHKHGPPLQSGAAQTGPTKKSENDDMLKRLVGLGYIRGDSRRLIFDFDVREANLRWGT